MFGYLLSVISVIAACAIAVGMVVRSGYMPPLARYAICATMFGLLMGSQYAEAANSAGAYIFIIGNAGLMILVAVRHFKAYPRQG